MGGAFKEKLYLIKSLSGRKSNSQQSLNLTTTIPGYYCPSSHMRPSGRGLKRSVQDPREKAAKPGGKGALGSEPRPGQLSLPAASGLGLHTC